MRSGCGGLARSQDRSLLDDRVPAATEGPPRFDRPRRALDNAREQLPELALLFFADGPN
jgi:hypothetical protein